MGVESLVVEQFDKLRLENKKLRECIVQCSEGKDLEDVQFELHKCLEEIMGNKPQFISIKDLGTLINQKESWIRSKVFSREIPFFKMGRHVRFKRSEINTWLEKGRVVPKEERNG